MTSGPGSRTPPHFTRFRAVTVTTQQLLQAHHQKLNLVATASTSVVNTASSTASSSSSSSSSAATLDLLDGGTSTGITGVLGPGAAAAAAAGLGTGSGSSAGPGTTAAIAGGSSSGSSGPPGSAGHGGRQQPHGPSGGVVLNENGMVVEQTPEGEWTYDPNEPRYCICNQVSYGDMVACDNEDCPFEWFHYPCVNITSSPKGKWYCPQCSSSMKRRASRKN